MIVETVLGLLGAGAGGGAVIAIARYAVPPVARFLKHWSGNRAQIRRDQIAADALDRQAAREHESGLVERLSKRIDKLEASKDDCEERLSRAREECAEEIGDLRRDLGRVSDRLAEELRRRARTADDTGVHELEEITARSSPELAALGPPRSVPPPLRRSDRKDMEP